eukprot:gene19510-40823_t
MRCCSRGLGCRVAQRDAGDVPPPLQMPPGERTIGNNPTAKGAQLAFTALIAGIVRDAMPFVAGMPRVAAVGRKVPGAAYSPPPRTRLAAPDYLLVVDWDLHTIGAEG